LSLGQLITRTVPEPVLKLGIGTLILLFGLRWLLKAVLRSAGVIALHDENAEFEETKHDLEAAGERIDAVAFTLAFKGVFLEGLEVAFIVFAVGASGRSLGVATVGALVAMVLVAGAGLVVRHPLSTVPENTLKYAVGLILSSLGTFWAAEGMGASWPLDLVSALLVALIYWLGSRAAVLLIRQVRAKPVLSEVA
jgi:uncharacterized membrane protein